MIVEKARQSAADEVPLQSEYGQIIIIIVIITIEP